MSATNMPPLTAMLSDEMWERLRVMWGSSALVQEMREELACTRSEHVAAPDVLTITNPEMLEHRGIRAGDIILAPDGTRAVARRDYMLVEAGVEPGEPPAADLSRGARTPCVRCTLPEATATDLEAWNHLQGGQPLPPGWPDDQGSHLCWREVANGDCCPEGPEVRVTAGRLVLHDDDLTLLSAPVEDVIAALREAGVLSGPTAEEHAAELARLRARDAGSDDDGVPRYALAALRRATLAMERGDDAVLATVHGLVQPLVDAAMRRIHDARDRAEWPRWVHRRAERTVGLWLPSHELLAVVWGADGEQPGWRAWHAPLGSGPPCPWEQGAGGIDEAEAYLVKCGRIRPGCTIRPVSG